MSIRWLQSLSQPHARLEKVAGALLRASRGLRTPEALSGMQGALARTSPPRVSPTALGSMRREAARIPAWSKVAEDGHWRRLPPSHVGEGPGGEDTPGRTWVNKVKPGMKPKEHQVDFIRAVEQNPGVIAAHGTGTGKTFSAIAAFEDQKGKGRAKKALVVTPAGLRDNFLRFGVEKFTTSKGVVVDRPEQAPADAEYVITSYEAFRDRPQEFMDVVKPDTVIADEFHRASNPESKTYQAFKQIRPQVQRFMGLTASISQNNPSDIVPLLDIATGGEQSIKSKGQFRRMHIQRKPSEARGIFGGKTYEKYLVREALLKNSVGGTVHYVEDLDATEKPAKDVETVPVLMSPQQVGMYRQAMKGIDPRVVAKIQAGEPVDDEDKMIGLFERLQVARQLSNSVAAASPKMDLAEAAEKTPKVKKILDDAEDHLKKTPDGQIIMYTNLVHGGVDVLMAGLQQRGVPFGLFVGRGVPGMTEEKRQQSVQDYLAGKKKVIIITGAGAEGLSLGNTTMVQMVDGHYNPERIAQAEARGVRAGGLAHRAPDERRVRVKRYVSAMPKTFWQTITFREPEKTVDQFVYRTADQKDRLNRQMRDVLAQRSAHETKKRDSTLYRWFGGGP